MSLKSVVALLVATTAGTVLVIMTLICPYNPSLNHLVASSLTMRLSATAVSSTAPSSSPSPLVNSSRTRGPTPGPAPSPSPRPMDRWSVIQLPIDDVGFLLQQLALLQSQSTAVSAGAQAAIAYRSRLDNVTRRVSRRLNDAYRVYQQVRCRSPGTDFTETGAWCERAVQQLHITDRRLAAGLAQFLAGKTVLSLGDGTGIYRQWILNSPSKVLRYDAYDGAPFSQEATNGTVQFIDLTLPQYWLPRYDWVLCLEVIEHIPADYESIVLDNIVRPAVEGVILSWAVPTQPGARHINARQPGYGDQLMKQRGFELDRSASQLIRNSSELSWFRNNIGVYRKLPSPT